MHVPKAIHYFPFNVKCTILEMIFPKCSELSSGEPQLSTLTIQKTIRGIQLRYTVKFGQVDQGISRYQMCPDQLGT